jgi:hypothetical protein
MDLTKSTSLTVFGCDEHRRSVNKKPAAEKDLFTLTERTGIEKGWRTINENVENFCQLSFQNGEWI